ncbi:MULTISPECIES: hypothetical protein [Atopobiaceae]|uniref:hypothetical protein n=1 Tax=Atopobiaceae TaxID=1643824 RepID=UPI00117FF363|nr:MULTISPECIES: hypothetical protein [Atopobiaceae]MCR8908166.1 hypothetical protein [Thermophilibacter sp. ET337]
MFENEVARFESAGDVRTMHVYEEDGRIVVREDLEGPSTLIVYGEDRRSLRVAFGPEALAALLAAIGFAGSADSLWGYVSREDHDIVDLMDLCDQRGIPYEFSSIGSGGDCQLRPAAC